MDSYYEIKQPAKEAFRTQKGTCIQLVLASFLFGLFTTGLNRIVSLLLVFPLTTLVNFFISLSVSAVAVNLIGAFIKIAKGEEVQVAELFTLDGFWRKSLTPWLMNLLIGLWMLLLIIPGLIKTIAYSFTYHLLAEYPDLSGMQAITLSKHITKGYKWDIFLFHLSFIGWFLLSIVSLGVMWVVYVGPYWQIAQANLYQELKKQALENGIISTHELDGTQGSIF